MFFNDLKVVLKDVEYKSPNELITPFVEKLKPFAEEFVNRSDSIAKAVDAKGDANSIYTKISTMCVLKREMPVKDYKQIIGLGYALDVRKPYYKIYGGYLNTRYNSLLMINPDIQHYEIDPDSQEFELSYVDFLLDKTIDLVQCDNAINATISGDKLSVVEELGSAIINSLDLSFNFGFGKIKIATSLIIKMYNEIYNNKNSPFSFSPGADCDVYYYYNALSNLIYNNNKDIINIPEKTLLIRSILGL